MRAYVGQTRGAKLIRELVRLGLGECTCRGEFPPRRTPWFLDNGAYRDWTAGVEWDSAGWLRDLRSAREFAVRPDFVVAPDLVAGGVESLAVSLRWLETCADMTPYLAVQDGMSEAEVAEAVGPFAGVFVGGTLDWKLRTGAAWVDMAHRVGKPCHVGRVGTVRRVRWAREIGADSIDSCLPLWSRENLAGFVAALKEDQCLLW